MSRPFIIYLCLNSITTMTFSYLYHCLFTKSTIQNELTRENAFDASKDAQIEYLCKKIVMLEDSVLTLQQTVEDLEEKLEKKSSRVLESNIALNSKLEEFISYNYDVYE